MTEIKLYPALVAGEDYFTLYELFQKAAEYKGLKFVDGITGPISAPIKIYTLDGDSLAALARRNINGGRSREGLFSLVDENAQEIRQGRAPSNHWNFRSIKGSSGKFDLRIILYVRFGLSGNKFRSGGVIFEPRAYSPFLSPIDTLPNSRMFRALVDNDPDAPAVAKEIAGSFGNITVTWSDLGFGGIKELRPLFLEFAGGDNDIFLLNTNGKVFDPTPSPLYKHGYKLFVPYTKELKVLRAWMIQFNEYRAHIVN